MKTNKEYPATHSMMTSWFAIDKDGNVAIMNYEDNGPVPIGTPESCPEELVMSDFPMKAKGKPYKSLKLTPDELQHLMDTAEQYPERLIDGEGYYNAVVQVTEDGMSAFLEAAVEMAKDDCDSTVCLSEVKRIFYLDWYAFDEKRKSIIKKVDAAGAIKTLRKIFWNSSDDETPLNELPFYVYNQPYSCGEPMERTYAPKSCFTEERLSQIIRKQAHRLPVRFSEAERIQIAEHLPSHQYGCDYKTIDNRHYAQETDADGREVYIAEESIYYADCGKNCRICFGPDDRHDFNYAVQKTKHPTVFVITDIKEIGCEISTSFDSPYDKAVFIPLIEGLPHNKKNSHILSDERKMSNFPIREIFSNCRFNLEKNIDFFKPRVILIHRNVMNHIEAFYRISDGHIQISGGSYPVFIWEERKKFIDEIKILAQMDYRGSDIQWKITDIK